MKKLIGPGIAASALLAVSLISLCIGVPFIGINRLPAAFMAQTGLEHSVVVLLRLPRLLLALCAGAALGVAGVLLQESLHNRLAVPELLGVSSGAAAAVGITVIWAIPLPGAPILPALIGAAAGGALSLLAARKAVGPAAILLIGAAVSAALQAIMLTAFSLSESREQGVLFRYLLGSLTGVTWESIYFLIPMLAITLVIAFFLLPVVEILRLGNDSALSLGLRTDTARVVILLVACVLVASIVGPAGPIAWVGFLGPQLARRIRPQGTVRVWYFWSAISGALLVAVADLAARTVLYPIELPVGGLTAIVALSFGLILLLRRRPTTTVVAEAIK